MSCIDGTDGTDGTDGSGNDSRGWDYAKEARKADCPEVAEVGGTRECPEDSGGDWFC